MGLKRSGVSAPAAPGRLKSDQNGIETTRPLGPIPIWFLSLKSDQNGIETLFSHAYSHLFFLLKSDQNGIETPSLSSFSSIDIIS